jgi:hypothetical protein
MRFGRCNFTGYIQFGVLGEFFGNVHIVLTSETYEIGVS